MNTASKLAGGIVGILAGMVALGVAVYLFFIYQLEASCLGGQGRGPCHGDVHLLVYLLLALIVAGLAIAGSFWLIGRGLDDIRVQNARSIAASYSEDEL